MKISLCMIVGNVAEYIDRCLTSFAPIADEICIIRAIGNQKPDDTLKIASEKFGARTAEYKNRPGHEHWPHIDDFAAARQMSFEMATGEYCFWCDSDDVLESGAELIRELAERGGYVAYVFPYKIFARGLVVNRARMMARGSGRWVWPVHEDYRYHIEPAPAVEDERVVITHLPDFATKSGSHERNLRILRSIPRKQMTPGLWYHLHVELLVGGDIPASIDAAKRALASPDIGRPEQYEIFLNLAQASKKPADKENYLHAAYKTDPRRREALALLANNALNFGQHDLGLAYASQMMATARGSAEWNDRTAVYGWVGEDIYAQALRANGRRREAETVRQASLNRAGGPRIALIHATRGRPEQAALARKMWLDLADRPDKVEHIFVFDDDDQESAAWLSRMHHLRVNAGGGCVNAWNNGAFATQAPVLVQMSDDWTPPQKWDQIICDRIGHLEKPAVLAISDGLREDKLLCMAICTRAYFHIDQFLFHPWFSGVYSDNWFTEQAYARGCVIDARDVIFRHEHPFAVFGKNMMPGVAPASRGSPKIDRTYAEQNAPARYEEGQRIIGELRQGRDWSTVPGFFNYWPFYQFIARGLQDGDTVCEVGVWLGRSIIFLAQALQRAGKKVRLIAVDHFRGESNQKEHAATVALCGGNIRAAFEANIDRCGVRDMIQIIDSDSAAAAAQIQNNTLAFCFIDAAHDFESVTRDIRAWTSKVKPGGTLAGHDADWPDVRRAVQESLPHARFHGCVWIQAAGVAPASRGSGE